MLATTTLQLLTQRTHIHSIQQHPEVFRVRSDTVSIVQKSTPGNTISPLARPIRPAVLIVDNRQGDIPMSITGRREIARGAQPLRKGTTTPLVISLAKWCDQVPVETFFFADIGLDVANCASISGADTFVGAHS